MGGAARPTRTTSRFTGSGCCVRACLVRRDDGTAILRFAASPSRGLHGDLYAPGDIRRFCGTCTWLPLRRRVCGTHRAICDCDGASSRRRPWRLFGFLTSPLRTNRARSAHIAGLLEPRDRIRNGVAIGPRGTSKVAPRFRVTEEHVMTRNAQPEAGEFRRLANCPVI